MVENNEPIEIGEKDERVEVEKKRKTSENMLNDILNTIREKQEDLGKSVSGYRTSLPKPLSDVMETENSIIVITDLPGVKKEDIDIDISEGNIDIIAKFEDEIEEEGTNYIKKERSYGETRRSISLPAKINIKKATAKFNDSILTVKLPKLKDEKHKVDIQ